jgi:hypothetical protein
MSPSTSRTKSRASSKPSVKPKPKRTYKPNPVRKRAPSPRPKLPALTGGYGETALHGELPEDFSRTTENSDAWQASGLAGWQPSVSC